MQFILLSTTVIVILTIASGIYLLNEGTDKKKIKKALGMNLLSFVPLVAMALVWLVPDAVQAATETVQAGGDMTKGLGYIAAALSTGFATIGTGVAVGNVGSAALGAVSEDESILGKTLIYVGLAEGIAIYGLIISIMILGQL